MSNDDVITEAPTHSEAQIEPELSKPVEKVKQSVNSDKAKAKNARNPLKDIPNPPASSSKVARGPAKLASGGSKYKAKPAVRIMDKVVASPAAQVDFTDVQGKVKEGLCEQSSSSLWIALQPP